MAQINFFFVGWMPLVRILVVGTAMYVSLVLFLRISGSRTLSAMNAFDFIVTVAIGSAFGRALTATDVSLAEAVVSFGLLVALQYLISKIQIRSSLFRRLITTPPALLYYKGEFVDDEMRRQRVAKSDLQSAVRKKQFDSFQEVEAIVLESNGEFSVIGSVDDESAFGEMLGEQMNE